MDKNIAKPKKEIAAPKETHTPNFTQRDYYRQRPKTAEQSRPQNKPEAAQGSTPKPRDLRASQSRDSDLQARKKPEQLRDRNALSQSYPAQQHRWRKLDGHSTSNLGEKPRNTGQKDKLPSLAGGSPVGFFGSATSINNSGRGIVVVGDHRGTSEHGKKSKNTDQKKETPPLAGGGTFGIFGTATSINNSDRGVVIHKSRDVTLGSDDLSEQQKK